MGMNYQLDRAWVNTSKGIRQCQKADSLLSKGDADSAASHFGKALGYFETAADHLGKAEQDAEIKAGKLVDDGNQQLQKAKDDFLQGRVDRAESHYEKALEKYDQALELVS